MMVDVQSLPKLSLLKSMALEIKTFPISGLGIVQSAEHLGFDDETINFIKLFSEKMIFNSRTEFLDYCRLLERLLKEERTATAELLRSPQD